ncbi:hypothetical protein N7528_009207 [Penicillium herquei]|nr:hypothetical protein N7528_009207 [Penicillium herquei]
MNIGYPFNIRKVSGSNLMPVPENDRRIFVSPRARDELSDIAHTELHMELETPPGTVRKEGPATSGSGVAKHDGTFTERDLIELKKYEDFFDQTRRWKVKGPAPG